MLKELSFQAFLNYLNTIKQRRLSKKLSDVYLNSLLKINWNNLTPRENLNVHLARINKMTFPLP